jgi:dienelactone hydrolase
MLAQMLAQTRPGARGALLLHACVPLSEFGGSWPAGVRLQIHTMEDDEWGDVDVAREIGAAVEEAEVFLYAGDRHLFTDDSLPVYDDGAATLVKQRLLAFLDEVGSSR